MNSPVLLYAEDSLDDRVLFIKACARAHACFRLFFSEHGQNAVDYLSGTGPYANRAEFPMPDAVLLDIKMPVLDGFGALRWIREQKSFRTLPIFMLTSSYQHADIEQAYAEKATAFLTKPSDFHGLTALAAALWECFASEEFRLMPLELFPQYKRLSSGQEAEIHSPG